MNVTHAVVVVHSIQHRFRTLASSVLGAQPPDGGRYAPHANLSVTVLLLSLLLLKRNGIAADLKQTKAAIATEEHRHTKKRRCTTGQRSDITRWRKERKVEKAKY